MGNYTVYIVYYLYKCSFFLLHIVFTHTSVVWLSLLSLHVLDHKCVTTTDINVIDYESPDHDSIHISSYASILNYL